MRPLPPPSDRSKVAALRGELASLDALLLTAQYGGAVEAAEALDARPDARSWVPFHADLNLRLGRALSGRGDFEEAESRLVEGYLEAVDSQSVDIASAIALELANLLGVQRQEPDRGMLWMRLAEVHERARGETPLRRAALLHRRSSLLKQMKRFDEAEAGYLEALELLQQDLGTEHLLVARTRNNLGNLYEEVSRFDEAITQYDAAISTRREILGDTHPDVAQTLVGMANTVGEKGDREEALALLQHALKTYQASLGDEHVLVALAHAQLAGAHLAVRELDSALEHATRAAEGQPAAAIAPARRAVALPGTDAASLAHAQFTLARALSPEPRRAVNTESLELARAALAGYGDSKAHAGSKAEVQAWLSKRGE